MPACSHIAHFRCLIVVFLLVDYSYCWKHCHCYWRKTQISHACKLHLPFHNFNDFTVLVSDNNRCSEDNVNIVTRDISYLSVKHYFLHELQDFQRSTFIENNFHRFTMLMLAAWSHLGWIRSSRSCDLASVANSRSSLCVCRLRAHWSMESQVMIYSG